MACSSFFCSGTTVWVYTSHFPTSHFPLLSLFSLSPPVIVFFFSVFECSVFFFHLIWLVVYSQTDWPVSSFRLVLVLPSSWFLLFFHFFFFFFFFHFSSSRMTGGPLLKDVWMFLTLLSVLGLTLVCCGTCRNPNEPPHNPSLSVYGFFFS